MTGDWPFRIFPRFFLIAALAAVGCALLVGQLRPGTKFSDCDGCPEMIVIPAGSFTMGDSTFGHPPHLVTIGSRFAVSKDMITRAEYEEFLRESGYSADPSWREAKFQQGRSLPASYVDWQDAQAYVKWLSKKSKHRYRLLSEAEYEYAGRSGAETAYWWGDDPSPICSYVNTAECHYGGPTVVGSHRPNGFGLDDMTGNEFEWVQDCWHWSYDGAPDDGTAWNSGECGVRTMRGCAWFVDSAHMRAAYRNFSDSGNRSEVIGFRVARDL
jgi:formylglycine-generating enzyme required for sulfatase activity